MKKVQISDSGEKVINRFIESGQCDSPDQVVEISLQLLSDHEEKLDALRKDLAVGAKAAKAGHVAPSNVAEAKERYRHERTGR